MSSGKPPAFQFYPGDWLRDTALRACSVGARGLWIDMICIMHQGDPYGHLTVSGVSIDVPKLARMVGCSPREAAGWLGELDLAKVFSRTDESVIYSRRMVSDQATRAKRAAGGQLGGNPVLKVKSKVVEKVNHELTIDLTPSSSSSSSSSSSINRSIVQAPTGSGKNSDRTTERPNGFIFDWQAVSDRLAAIPINNFRQAIAEAQACGCTPDHAMALLDFATANGMEPGAIVWRFKRANLQMPLDRGWPVSSPESDKVTKKATADSAKLKQEKLDSEATALIKKCRGRGIVEEAAIKSELAKAGLEWPR